MVAPISQVFYDSVALAFGNNVFLFGFAVVFFAFLFAITRQSLASSLLLGMVALDGMERLSDDDNIFFLNLLLKILIFGGIGFVIATTVFKK